jgi:predicted RNA-binding Zn-ribbon protein involved in translation (DUF1610 family)
MPGSIFEIECPGCASKLEITTGAGGVASDPQGAWSYEQFVCTSCKQIVSRTKPDVWAEGPNCTECGEELVPWAGRVWFDRTVEGLVGSEHVEGPCPACGTAFTGEDATSLGLWD